MEVIVRALQEVSEQFILGQFGSANHQLAQLIDTILKDETTLRLISNHVKVLEEIMLAQKNKNYLYVADLLQYELIPLLSPRVG